MDFDVFSWFFLASCFLPIILGEELLQVNILFRHGDRSPCETFPSDRYQEGFWPRGWGQLSKKGQERHLGLGKFFRRRYGGLIGKYYHPDTIYVRSTDVDRTLMSAMANLAGLFPPNKNETWSNEITHWEPLPVHTVPHSADTLLVRGNRCPRYHAMCEELYTTRPTPEVIVEETRYASFWNDVRKYAGLPSDLPLNDMWPVADSLFIERSLGLALPGWVDGVYDHLMEYVDLNFKMMVYNRTLARLAGGNLLNEIRNNMKAKLAGKKKMQPVRVYSAHDDTVAPFLAALDVFNDLAPPYASAVMVELWKSEAEKEPFVRVYYRNDTSINPAPPLLLTVPGCHSDCPWSQFLSLTSDSFPKDYAEECEMPEGLSARDVKRIRDTHPANPYDDPILPPRSKPTSTPEPPSETTWFAFGCILLISSVVFIICFTIFVFVRKFKVQIVLRNPEQEPLLKSNFR